MSVDIQKDLLDWTKNTEQALYALLGDYGMGKTFNLRMFASHLWKTYEKAEFNPQVQPHLSGIFKF